MVRARHPPCEPYGSGCRTSPSSSEPVQARAARCPTSGSGWMTGCPSFGTMLPGATSTWFWTDTRWSANSSMVPWFEDPWMVWHLPPTSTVERYLDTPGRVDFPGVEENIYGLHAAYQAMMNTWPGPHWLIHDWTKDQHHTRLIPALDQLAPMPMKGN